MLMPCKPVNEAYRIDGGINTNHIVKWKVYGQGIDVFAEVVLVTREVIVYDLDDPDNELLRRRLCTRIPA